MRILPQCPDCKGKLKIDRGLYQDPMYFCEHCDELLPLDFEAILQDLDDENDDFDE